MKVYAISDLHLSSSVNKPMDIFKGWNNYVEKIIEDWQSRVKSQDVVLLSGDFSWAMEYKDAVDDIKLIGGLNGKKIIIKGNHDYWWKSITALRDNLPSGMFALQNDSVRIDNLLVCGCRGWLQICKSEQDKKIYNRELERLKLSLQAMQKDIKSTDTVVAMCHYPPFGSNLGESPFTKLYTQYNIKKVVYGHLHGNSNTPQRVVVDNTEYLLASCDLVGHKLVEVVTL